MLFVTHVGVGVQALAAQKTAKLKRVYYDWADMLATNPSGNVPYTPSIPLLYGLKETLTLLREEGMANVIARHHRFDSYLHVMCRSAFFCTYRDPRFPHPPPPRDFADGKRFNGHQKL